MKPDGLKYYENFISREQEQQFIEYLQRSDEWMIPDMGRFKVNREVIQYGYAYPYNRSIKKIERTTLIPETVPFSEIVAKLQEIEPGFEPEQLIINKYESRQSIGKHIDHTKFFGPAVACLTLNRPAEMIFRNGKDKYVQPVAPRSLYIMTGDSRYLWTHEMKRQESNKNRYSLTFRSINQKEI